MTRLTDNTRGAFLMMGAMIGFTLNDACMKALSSDAPLAQLLFLRGVMTSVALAVMAHWLGALRASVSRRDAGLIALRSLAEAAAAFFFISALFNMPIANATAILQALPLSVTLGAALVFRERIGWRRMLAIVIGFAGVLLIVRPGPEGFNFYSLYALAAVVAVTLRDLVVRSMSRDVPSLTIALAGSVAVCLFGGAWSVAVDWAPMTPRVWTLLSGSTVFLVAAYALSVLAMRAGDIGFVAPFRYTSLVAALILGFLIFGEWPDAVTLLGAGLVVATGVFTILREQRLRQRTARANAA